MWRMRDSNPLIQLAKLSVQPVSLIPHQYGYLDSNQGQLHPKCSILPTELHPYIAESIVLETNTLLGYSLFSRQDYHLDSLLSFSFHHIFKEYLFLRRDEVPTPKHFTVQSVFKTVPSPTELPLHLPTYRCRIGLCSVISVQTMRELNPNLHIDSVICKPLHYIAYSRVTGN